MALVGSTIAVEIPVLNCIKVVSHSPPEAPILPAVVLVGVAIAVVWLVGIVMAMHHETDMWGHLVAGVGTPTLLLALITLPQLV